MGTCYTATSPVGAVLEVLQMRLTNLLRAELETRRRAGIVPPDTVPAAAKFTARKLTGAFGITVALWAGGDRALTQSWAAALRRDGWWALYGGISHDPGGRLRGVSLFDSAGSHPPTVGGEWSYTAHSIADDASLISSLSSHGVTVRDPGELSFQKPASAR